MLHQFFLLLLALQMLSTGDGRNISQKRRQKREWLIPTKKITENVDYSNDPVIGRMRSDIDDKAQLRYTLRGPGANQPPVGYFIVEEYKGLVRMTQPMDREERQNYTLIGTAWFINNSIAEDNIRMRIIVEDQNDNAPVFVESEQGAIYERSPVGTFVTQAVATDADEPNTLRTKIAYSIIKQEPYKGKLFFAINKDNGVITVEHPEIDREEYSSYVLTVQAADMYGSAGGNTATANISVEILDMNDNMPTLEKKEFSASIDENVAHIEVLRIPAMDLDEKWTDNWLTIFTIVSGNEDGLFSIETDPRTNVGILYLNKPVDFETASNLNLNLVIENKAPLGSPLVNGGGQGSSSSSGAGSAAGAGGQAGGQAGASVGAGGFGASGGSGVSGSGGKPGGSGGQSGASGSGSSSGTVFSVSKQTIYLVKISVQNKPEDPKFKPNVKPISVSENGKNFVPAVIGSFIAVEEDTGSPAENVKYAKGYDPDNWISIDMDTAEIKLNKLPDRESSFVVNGTYYAQILSITNELNSQTATGTIALQIEDTNDNCPKLLVKELTVCSDGKKVNVTAEDTDGNPNGAPLQFTLIEEKTRGKWNIQRINDVSALLTAEEPLWPGFYEIAMEIKDMQGLSCPEVEVLHLEVCTCSNGTHCNTKLKQARDGTSKKFGLSGLSFVFLGCLSLIAAIFLLISCNCGSGGKEFIDMPFESKQHLITYSTEGQGEDKDVLLMQPTLKLHHEGIYETIMQNNLLRMKSTVNSKHQVDEMKVSHLSQTKYDGNPNVGVFHESAFGGYYCDSDGVEQENSTFYEEQESSLEFMRDYLIQKTRFLLDRECPEDDLTCYRCEGEGSLAGSFDDCSYKEPFDDLEFLNGMDSKFICLAEVCGYKHTPSDSKAESLINVKTVESPTTTTSLATTSSNQESTVDMPSNSEITLKSSTVQTVPCQQIIMQEPLFYEINQPVSSNVLLSENMVGNSLYIINNTTEPERFLIQGNTQTLTHLNNGQHRFLAKNTVADSPIYSEFSEGLVEGNPAAFPNQSPSANLVMIPQQLNGVGSLQMVTIPTGLVVTEDNIHGGLILLDSPVNELLEGGQSPMNPQHVFEKRSQQLGGSIQIGQPISEPLFYVENEFPDNKNNISQTAHGQLLVSSPILSHSSEVSGSMEERRVVEGSGRRKSLLIRQSPVPMTLGNLNQRRVSLETAGQINNTLLVSGPVLTASTVGSGELGGRRASILECPVSGGDLLVAVSGQFPATMVAGTPKIINMSQVVNRQVNNPTQVL